MITEIDAGAFRQNLDEWISRVQCRRDSVVISQDGRAVAALIDPKLFERIRQMQERFDALAARLAEAYAAMPEPEGMAEIQHAVAAERAERRGRGKRER